MIRRIVRGVFIAIVCMLVVAHAPLPGAVAQQSSDNGLEVVRAAYNITLDKYYRPLNPAELLQGGWDELASAIDLAGNGNIPAPPPLPAMNNDRDAAFAAFSNVYNTYVASLPANVRPLRIGFLMANAMLDSLNDGHTSFIEPSSPPPDTANAVTDEPVGLGVHTTGKVPLIITEVASGSPADKAGLTPGDVIVTVNGTDISTTSAALQAVSGLSGGQLASSSGQRSRTVQLTISRDGQKLDVTMTPGPYYFPTLTTRMLTGGAAYLRLTSFVQISSPLHDGQKVLDELDRDLDQFDAQGATGLVVDLRGNPGGEAVNEWLGRFLPENTLSMVAFDARGHQATGIVSGQMHRTQLPMVVLVNGSSYSAAEEFASAMHESGRALLVGRQTGGGLREAEIFSLPNGASMEVAVADVETAYEHYQSEGKGYPVDVSVPDSRTAADYRAGRDPQLDVAVSGLSQAPAPPAYNTTFTGVSREQLAAMFHPYFPDASQIPTTSRLPSVEQFGSFDSNHVNQAVDGARDPLALQQVYRQRGWLGSHEEGYAVATESTPSVGVAAELYATPQGAEQGLTTNDSPDTAQLVQSPVKLGDDAMAFRGLWTSEGAVGISWRRGNVVFTVSYDDAPGFENMDEAIAVAQLVDQAYSRNPLASVPVPAP